MPNFKIFQDVADQARVKIYGNNISTGLDQVLSATTSGALSVSIPDTVAITGSVSIPATVAITGSVSIPATVAITGSVSIPATVAITGSVSIPATVAITGSISTSVASTDVTLAVTSSDNTAYSGAWQPLGTPSNVLGIPSWTYAAVNNSSADTAMIQIGLSPDGVNYVFPSNPVTVAPLSANYQFESIVMKYAALYYWNAVTTGDVSLNLFFQGELA